MRRKAQREDLPFFPGDDDMEETLPIFDEEEDLTPKKKKKNQPKSEVGQVPQDKDKLRVFAALVFAFFGGNVTVKEAGDGKLLLTTLTGNKWRILIDGDRINIKGYPNLPNFTNFVGKVSNDDLLGSLVKVSESLVREVQEAEKVEPPSQPVSFEGIAAPPSSPMPATNVGLQPANPSLNAPGMPPLPPDMGMPGGTPGGLPGGMDMGMTGAPDMGMTPPPPPPQMANDMGMAPMVPIPGAAPPPPPPPGQDLGMPPPGVPPMGLAASRQRRTASTLDRIANTLEMAGHKDLAERLDRITNSLEKQNSPKRQMTRRTQRR